jgi:hypothetical protein
MECLASQIACIGENYPFGQHGQYKGHVEEWTFILEVVASHDTWIWHSFWEWQILHNDINVLQCSPVFSRLAKGNFFGGPLWNQWPLVRQGVLSSWWYLSILVYCSWLCGEIFRVVWPDSSIWTKSRSCPLYHSLHWRPWYVANVSIILMLHACFTLIAICFVYTLWYVYAFYGTNLLTRCHSANSCFLLFLYFRKVVQKIFSELDETKPEVPILLSRTWSP